MFQVRLATLAFLLSAFHAQAHEVVATSKSERLAVVTFTYADGTPLAFEQFEVLPVGEQAPSQYGRTDSQGRAAVLAVPGKAVRIVLATRDGHGTTLPLPVAASDATPVFATDGAPRWLLLAAGAGLVFGLFGLLQLVLKSRGGAGQ